MSEVLTRLDDFHPAPVQPFMQSTRYDIQKEATPNIRGVFAAALLSATVVVTSPVLTSLTTTYIGSSAAPEAIRHHSPAALTEKYVRAKLEDFVEALSEAFDLSNTLVAEEEAVPIDVQTLTYAIEALVPLISAMGLPSPLMLPLQGGGIGAEWHIAGMNIELRFRDPYHVYTVVEDAQGTVLPYHGRDPYLAQARSALLELGKRVLG